MVSLFDKRQFYKQTNDKLKPKITVQPKKKNGQLDLGVQGIKTKIGVGRPVFIADCSPKLVC